MEDLRCSSVYETEPMYVEGQPPFLNLCCVGRTRLGPGALLEALLEVEAEAGRARREANGSKPRYGPRRLDLDLLLYGDSVIDRTGLVVPHPRMTERAFVLVPLAEVASELVHPVVGRTVGELAWETERSGVRRTGDRLPAGGEDGVGEVGSSP